MEFQATQTPLFTPEGTPDEFGLVQAQREKYALLPIESRKRPRSVNKSAIIFWGPPNSGKTTGCSEYVLEKQSADAISRMVAVSYDEPLLYEQSGALFNIPAYAETYAEQAEVLKNGGTADRDLLAEKYRMFRSDSQRIRSMTLNEAVRRGHSLCIDTTSSGQRIFEMIETLQKAGYKIHIVGMIAPLDLAVKRSDERLRLVEPEEVFSKRAGALGTFKKLISLAETTVLLDNSVQGSAPTFVLKAHHGVLVRKNDDLVKHIISYLSREPEYCRKHPIGQKYAGEIQVNGADFTDVIDAPTTNALTLRDQRGLGFYYS
jgi:predicted ABC-type ATPase